MILDVTVIQSSLNFIISNDSTQRFVKLRKMGINEMNVYNA